MIRVMIKTEDIESNTSVPEYSIGTISDGGQLTRLYPWVSHWGNLPLAERQRCTHLVERTRCRMGGVAMGRGPMGTHTSYRDLHACYLTAQCMPQKPLEAPVIECERNKRLSQIAVIV
jgi:hypothetical protein